MANQPKYRNHPHVALDLGGVARPVYGARAHAAARTGGGYEVASVRRTLDRELHTVAVRAVGQVSIDVPAAYRHWAYDLRRGRLRVYGSLLRVIDLLHRRGVRKDVALLVPQWLTAYIDDVWSDTPADRRADARRDTVRRDRAQLVA